MQSNLYVYFIIGLVVALLSHFLLIKHQKGITTGVHTTTLAIITFAWPVTMISFAIFTINIIIREIKKERMK